jgi:hypothetical protein
MENNRVVEWRPTLKQEESLSLPDSIFEALYGGSAGAGKSDLLTMLPLARGFHEYPRFKGIIFRRTFPELQREIIERSLYWYPMAGGRYNSSDHQWRFPSSAIIRFGHMEYENDARKYDSDEYNYIAFDELTSFLEFQYMYLVFSRCRTSTNLPAFARAGTNPGNIGHGWVKERFVTPGGREDIPYGTILREIKLVDGSPREFKRIFIQAFVKDNPHIDKEYYTRLSLLPEAERQAKQEGRWDTYEGQVFTDWRDQHIPGEPENAIHVCDPFTIPSWWPRFLAIDWGFAAYTVAYWFALSPKGQVYLYREYSCKETNISVWASEIKSLSQGETLEKAVMCRSAWDRTGDDTTIQEKFTLHSGITVYPANNARIAGKTLLQEYMRWKPLQTPNPLPKSEYNHEEAVRIMRMKGMDAYREYVKKFEPSDPEQDLPRLQVFSTCKGFRHMVPLCIYGKKDSDGKPSEDVREFEGDDFYDPARYGLMEIDQFSLESLKGKVVYHKQIGEILSDFEKNQDQTALHRRLESVERTSQVKVKPAYRRGAYVSRLVR